jgi:hypothetical protein
MGGSEKSKGNSNVSRARAEKSTRCGRQDDEEITIDLTGDDGNVVVTTKPSKRARALNDARDASRIEAIDD